jgi:hypothetical protein
MATNSIFINLNTDEKNTTKIFYLFSLSGGIIERKDISILNESRKV